MQRVVLLHVDGTTAAALAESAGAEVVATPDLETALGLAEREPGGIGAMVIGTWQSEPLAAALRVRNALPRLPQLLLAEPAREHELAEALQRDTLRGNSVRCLPVSPLAPVVEAVAEAVRAGKLRQAHEAQVAAANQVLRQQQSPPRAARDLGRLLEDAPLGVLVIDAADGIVASNRLGNVLLGRDPKKVGESFPDLLPAAARASWRASIAKDPAARIRMVLETGSTRLLELTASRVDEGGGPPERLVFLADVTDRVTAERERGALLEQLQATGHFREQFIGILAHDLRSPLQSISMTTRLLLKNAEGSNLRPLARISASAERMSRMIGDVLDFTRTRLGGGLPLHPVQVDLAALCRQLLEELEVTAPDRAIRLDLRGDVSGRWDSDRLHQLLGNLLGNALRYGPPESEIRLTVAGTPEAVRIEVHNRGEPISAELLPEIFEPFQRATSETRSGGLGLGLYIVREIVRAHGGTASVQSTAAAGTCFTVLLPRAGPPAG